jgi:uncharacterized membrane protein YdjX (TVP38/TMEM64 family)
MAGGGLQAVLKGLALLAVLLAAGLLAHAYGAGLLAHITPTPAGTLAFVAAGAILSAAGVPRQVVAFAAGYAFGFWHGAALALLAQMLGCAADFWLARVAARAWAMRRIQAAAAGRMARLDRFLAANPFTATLTLRLLPVGNNLVLNLLAGVSAMAAAPFLAATLVGYVPQTLVFALAGSGTQVDRTHQIILAAALFVASAALGLLLLRSANRTPA